MVHLQEPTGKAEGFSTIGRDEFQVRRLILPGYISQPNPTPTLSLPLMGRDRVTRFS
jgi:hypothetical protein